MNVIAFRGKRITAFCSICALALTSQITAACASTSVPDRRAVPGDAMAATREIGAATTLLNMGDSQIRVSALASASPSNSQPVSPIGISLDLISGQADDPSEKGFIDFDQAKTVISALTIMQQTLDQAAHDPQEQTSFHFATRHGIKIGFFQSSSKITAYIDINHRTHTFDVRRVSELKRAIQRAADTLNNNKPVVLALAAH